MRCIVVRGDAWPVLLSPCNMWLGVGLQPSVGWLYRQGRVKEHLGTNKKTPSRQWNLQTLQEAVLCQ